MERVNDKISTAGFVLERVYHPRQICRAESPPASTRAFPDEPEFTIAWDWRTLESDAFEVALTITIPPHPKRLEYTEVVTVGRFRVAGKAPSVAIPEFARVNASAILFPYARSVIATLTTSGVTGTLLLPALNIVETAKGFDPTKATADKRPTA